MSQEEPTAVPRHTIQVASRRSGVTQDTLRAWERRYGAVQPGRSEGRQRLYSDADIDRLRLLAKLVGAGHRIGHVAKLPPGEFEWWNMMVRRGGRHQEGDRRERRRRGGGPRPTLRRMGWRRFRGGHMAWRWGFSLSS